MNEYSFNIISFGQIAISNWKPAQKKRLVDADSSYAFQQKKNQCSFITWILQLCEYFHSHYKHRYMKCFTLSLVLRWPFNISRCFLKTRMMVYLNYFSFVWPNSQWWKNEKVQRDENEVFRLILDRNMLIAVMKVIL